MQGHEHWQLDGTAPELYQRYLVPAITSLWAADLIERAQPVTGNALLDVACGTGVVARMAAERMAAGRVVGLDFNSGMLAVARSQRAAGAAIEWIEGSALNLPFPDGSFDVVLCQLGLQFFPDRPLALREMKRVLVPSGRLALSVFSAIERTPGADAFARALDHCVGPNASSIKRAEHIFPDAGEVRSLISAAGFERIDVRTIAKQISFPSLLDYVRFQLVATPMASLLQERTADERDTVIEQVAVTARLFVRPEFIGEGRFSFPQESHVVTALRPR
jgi:ubiquinone/menaquinone biosynthesis C-methylase UbiE